MKMDREAFTQAFACMILDGPSLLDERTRNTLVMAALAMRKEGRADAEISSNVLAGVVETDGDVRNVGVLSGVVFRATFESSGGDHKVDFLVSTQFLEKGDMDKIAWAEMPYLQFLDVAFGEDSGSPKTVH